jgi:hypothetical protein
MTPNPNVNLGHIWLAPLLLVTCVTTYVIIKSSQNKKGQKRSSCTQNGVFFSAGSWEKDTVLGAARKIFGPSYFVMALVLEIVQAAK